MSVRGKVYLVGAGPGSPGLITVRGLELLRTCDVLVYDNLMADEYVGLSEAAEKIYVGKASGRHMHTQEAIAEILVDGARRGAKVVRLKGGDPFVFGRGGEECQALARAGIDFEIVPGVTAGISGPAFFGIPVTHRELSRGVTLVTGHFSRDQQVELPWEALAGLEHTLVFYMAVSALDEVTRRLNGAGLDGGVPAALVEQATTGSQRIVRATLETIAERGRERDVRPPALLVVGDVVRLGEELSWVSPRPLAGKMVLFTRASDREYDAVDRLRDLGAKVVDVPVVGIESRLDDEDVRRGIEELDRASAVVFTSTTAVETFFEALECSGRDARALSGRIVAAATGSVVASLRRHGITPDVDVHVARDRGVLEALRERGLAERSLVLLPRSAAARPVLVDSFREAGYDPRPVLLYTTRPADLEWLQVKMAGRRVHAVVFLSGSGVDAVLEAVPGIAASDPPPIWACVGRITAASLRERGLEPDVVPATPDVDALVDDLVEKLGAQP